ncbi:MAG: prenyltransferase [Lachnospiraceae bacterium]|nr:prenyltransferase [Lachnospiraceae bacterium]
MKKYISLLRVKHYVKNLLILTPLFFGEGIFDMKTLTNVVYALIIACLVSSTIYILNDINDIEKDRKHPVKCNRPLASGIISIRMAITILIVLYIAIILLSTLALFKNIFSYDALLWLIAYIIINLLYSRGLKNVPVMDVVILASGFVIRLYYGSCVANVAVSSWLYLTVLGGAFYLGMGKRRNELQKQSVGDTREVLRKYSYAFLDKNMHMCAVFTEVCYALWAVQNQHKTLMWTVPIVMIIFMKYSLDIESTESDGNPIDVVLEDKTLLLLLVLYALVVFLSIYVL